MESVTTIYINSKDLSSGSVNNFNYQLPQGITNATAYYIKNVSIPFSQYVTIYSGIESPIDTISFLLNDGSGPHTVELIAGNYSAFQAGQLLQTALNTASGSTDYTVLYNSNTYTYTISSTGGNFQIAWINGDQLVGQEISRTFGFLTNLTGASVYNSTSIANANGSSLNYYIKSNSFTLDGSYSYFNGKKDSVICQIPIDQAPGGYLLYENKIQTFIPLLHTNLYSLDLQLVDDYNNPVLLGNGVNYTITLVIKNLSS